ncbi:MAG TPA: hypothetical protein PLB92_14505, partial [Rhodoglobus sp.]|nr:hypothetical protein [Rhodoglobus sp.]
MNPAVATAGPQAAARVARTITLVAGVATLVFFGLSLGPIISSLPYLDPWYDISSAVALFGIPVVV